MVNFMFFTLFGEFNIFSCAFIHETADLLATSFRSALLQKQMAFLFAI